LIRFSGSLILFILILSASSGAAIKQQMPPDAKPIAPNDCVMLAAADAQSVPIAHGYRYLTLANYEPAKRPEMIQCLDYVLNSLSRRRLISYCHPVQNSNFSVVRVDLDAYGMPYDVWEQLAEKGSGPTRVTKKTDQPEPYFQLVSPSKKTTRVKKQRQQKDAQGRPLFYDGGRGEPAMEDYYEDQTDKTFFGNWIDAGAAAALAKATGSNHPILRADWFIGNATIAPAYNELLGFKKLEDFQDFVRYRQRDYDLATKGIVTDSQKVALHQRAVLITPTSLGRYHETFDYLTSTGDDDLLKDLVKRRRDAGEIFAEGPNGLQYYLLINGKNEIIDFADPNVATDQETHWRNKLVWGGMVSCVGCHTDGTMPVNDEVRALTKPPLALQIPLVEKKKAEEVADLFFSGNIDDPLNLTRSQYASRVNIASRGLTPAKNGALLRQQFVNYQQQPLLLADAAREVGATPAEVRKVIETLKAPAPSYVLTQLIAGRPVRRDQWEAEGYSQLAPLIHLLKKGQGLP
jgi:hypothetical protein